MGRPEQVVTLHDAATADANGMELDCVHLGSIGVQITGTFSAVVYFEGNIDDTNWVALIGTNVSTGACATSASAAGIWEVATGGVEKFRARLDWTSGTSITVSARLNSTGVDAMPGIVGGSAASLATWLGGDSKIIDRTPTISTTPAYTAGDAIGGLLTFTDAARATGKGGLIETVVIRDNYIRDAAMDLLFYQYAITVPTDNAVFDPSDADNVACLGHVVIGAANYCDFYDNSVATVRNVGISYTCNATSLYGVLVARSTPTYSATNDITVRISVMRE